MNLNLKQEQKDDSNNYKRSKNMFSIEQEIKQINSSIRNVSINSFPVINPIEKAFMERYREGFPSHLSFDDILKLLKDNEIYLGISNNNDDLLNVFFVFTVQASHGYDFDYYESYINSNNKQLIKSIGMTLMSIGYANSTIMFENIYECLKNEENELEEHNYYLEMIEEAVNLFSKLRPIKSKSKYITRAIEENTENAKALEYLMKAFDLTKNEPIIVGYTYNETDISLCYISEFNDYYNNEYDYEYSCYNGNDDLGELIIIPNKNDIIKSINNTKEVLYYIDKFFNNFKA